MASLEIRRNCFNAIHGLLIPGHREVSEGDVMSVEFLMKSVAMVRATRTVAEDDFGEMRYQP